MEMLSVFVGGIIFGFMGCWIMHSLWHLRGRYYDEQGSNRDFEDGVDEGEN